MAHLQVRNVPPSLHRKLRSYAKKRGRTLGEVVLDAVQRQLSFGEFEDHLKQREAVDLNVSAATLLDEARQEHGK